MDILFVVPYVPSPVRVRPYHLIRALARRGHRIMLATVWASAGERTELDRLAAEGIRVHARHLPPWRSAWNCLRAAPGQAPLQAAYCWQPALARELVVMLRQSAFDVVHVEHLRGARYALDIAGAFRAQSANAGSKPGRTALIWDSVDCISHLFEQAAHRSRSVKTRLMARFELQRTRTFEGWMVSQVDRVLVTSEADRRALGSLPPHGSRISSSGMRPPPDWISVLPNGVDLEYFMPLDEPREPATLVITGKMSYHANVTAVQHLLHDIMPRIWTHRPEVRVWVVGQSPPRELRQLGSTDLSKPGRVAVTGAVPDIRPYLWRSTLAVAPLLYGAGIQNKVLEAMACATPVVASPLAVSALTIQPGQDVALADSADEFAWAVLSLLDDPQRCAQLGKAARGYVQAHHAWTAVAGQLEEIYENTTREVRCRAVEQG
jgi:glycosyltransferase involved in cell wall biosynthesis